MDANQVLLWMVGAACALTLVRLFRAAPAPRGWLAVSAGVLAVAGLGLVLFPSHAGFAAAALWALLAVVPALGIRWTARLVAAQRYAAARRLVSLLRWLHPADGWWEQPQLFEALEASQRGDLAAASALLEKHGAVRGPLRNTALSILYRLGGRWSEYRTWVEKEIPERTLERDPTLLPGYLRALGETGDLPRLVEVFDRYAASLEHGAPHRRDQAHLMLFAFCGRREPVERLFRALRAYPADIRAFWLATAEAAAGNTDAARELLAGLHANANADALMRLAVQRRLAGPALDAASLAPASREILRRAELRLDQEERFAERGPFRRGRPLVTAALVALILAGYGLEAALGGSTDSETLYRLGALVPEAFGPEDAWRLFAFLFLHYGPLHLLLNVGALLLLGPYLEFAVGAWRYLLVYFAAGVAGPIVLISTADASQAHLLVGASGGIMGVVGGTAAVLLRGWRRERAGVAARRLLSIGAFLVLQITFDLATPEVSFTAHFFGVIAGFVAAGLLKHRVSGGAGKG
jgi:rhomboid protease GluP